VINAGVGLGADDRLQIVRILVRYLGHHSSSC
jgi:hypothetical protein